jgi:predicted dehydrogenase
MFPPYSPEVAVEMNRPPAGAADILARDDELEHLLGAIAGRNHVAPHGGTYEDGYRAPEVCDAILHSSESGRCEGISYGAATE